MKERRSFELWAGWALILIAAALILSIFSMLSQTDLWAVYLNDTAQERAGWRYEVLAGGTVTEVQPVFPDEWSAYLPGEGIEAVRMSRVMTEEVRIPGQGIVSPRVELEPFDTRVELLLDGELLVTDMEAGERDENGFARLTDGDRAAMRQEYRKVGACLPEDYLGKTMTIMIYYSEPRRDPTPPYPFLTDDMMEYAPFVTSSVPEIAQMTGCALLTLLLLGVYVLEIRCGIPDAKILLPALFFLMLFLDKACLSTASMASNFYKYVNLSFLTDLYMAPLFLYLALIFSGWKRTALSVATVGWALYEGTRMYLKVRNGELLAGLSGDGLSAYLLVLLFAGAFLWEYFSRRRASRMKRIPKLYLAAGGLVFLGQIVFGLRVRNLGLADFLMELVNSAVPVYKGYHSYLPFVHFVTDGCSVLAAIVLVSEFVRRAVRMRETVSILEERSRLTLEGHERAARAEEATNAARHEMRHHLAVLSGLLKEGDASRAEEYLAELTETIDRLPQVRHSPNLLVNVIAGTYLDRARDEGIRVEHSLNVPANLEIPDRDLSVFLTNMLENALQACLKLGPERERMIRVKMHLHENALFIGCVNSADDKQGGEEPDMDEGSRRHGYGLKAMRRVAEKYDSILVIERRPGEFSVKSNLALPKPLPGPAAQPGR